jgi:hypothetical protein
MNSRPQMCCLAGHWKWHSNCWQPLLGLISERNNEHNLWHTADKLMRNTIPLFRIVCRNAAKCGNSVFCAVLITLMSAFRQRCAVAGNKSWVYALPPRGDRVFAVPKYAWPEICIICYMQGRGEKLLWLCCRVIGTISKWLRTIKFWRRFCSSELVKWLSVSRADQSV